MTAFGLIIGFIGGRFDCSRDIAISDILVLIITIQFTILGSEGSISVQYVQWMRALAIVGLLHFIFARKMVRRTVVPPKRGGPRMVGHHNVR